MADAEENAHWEERERQRRLREGPPTCVSCGRPMEMTPDGYLTHRCSATHESNRRGAVRRGHGTPVRTPTLGERYAEGFRMMGCDE